MDNKTTQFSPSLECAKFVANVSYKDLPASVVDFVKKDILDWIGCAIAGSKNPSAKPMKQVEELLGGNLQASIVGVGRGNLQYAAMTNAYFGHITETDDVDKESITHPATVNIPPALALTEYLKKDGKQLIVAVACGFEVMLRIGASVTPGHYKVFHTTATAGIFGAAMAAGKLLGLTETQLLSALGNAGTSSAGLWQFLTDGAMSKFLHTANAAGSGVLVALLAKEGFSGAKQILEGDQGFFVGYGRQEPKVDLFKDFGQNWRTDKVSFKPYPCCRHIHSAIDAALDIHDKIKGKKIKDATLYTYATANAKAGKRAPVNGRDGKFSLSYCVASTLLRGKPSLNAFSQSAVENPAVKALEANLKIEENDEFNKVVPRNWPARLEVETVDGQKYSAQVWNPTGDPENPLDWEALCDKFKLLTNGIISPEGQDKVISLCKDLETLKDPGQLLVEVNKDYKR